MLTGQITGDAEVVAYLERGAARLPAEITTGIGRLTLRLQRNVKNDKLSGQVLKVNAALVDQINLENSLAVARARGDGASTRQIQNQMTLNSVYDKYIKAGYEAGDASRLAAERQKYSAYTSAFGDNIARMVTLQQGFGTTIKGIWDSLLGGFQNMISRIVQQWLLSLITQEAMSKTFNAKEILMHAKVAAAAAWRATAAIPVVGPILAPIAAAAAFAGVLAFSAQDGYDVPGSIGPGIDGRGGQLGVVHPREMILPAEIADQFRNGGGRGDVHYHDHTQRGLTPSEIMRNRGALAKALEMAYRDGMRPKGMR